MIKGVIAFVLSATFSSNCFAQDAQEISSAIDPYLKSANAAHQFNGVAAVLYKNEVLLNAGYGFSNRSLSVGTLRIHPSPIVYYENLHSSIILKLQDEGKLSVNDKLSKYLPEFPNTSKISTDNLLTHSSGIHNYTDDVGTEDSLIVNRPIARETLLNHLPSNLRVFRARKII